MICVEQLRESRGEARIFLDYKNTDLTKVVKILERLRGLPDPQMYFRSEGHVDLPGRTQPSCRWVFQRAQRFPAGTPSID